MKPADLGDTLARLVWESFSDFLEREAAEPTAGRGRRRRLVHEELLILFLWVHTRVCQQAFARRGDPDRVKQVLDRMHAAVFEDLEAHGMKREDLPRFEQRITARYAEYYIAADSHEETVGEIAARNVSGRPGGVRWLSAALAEATVAVAGPLRDYLEEVVLG